jgi:hypothetical protein
MPASHQASVNIRGNSSFRADAKVIRGRQSWAFIRTVLAFVVGVELAIIPLLADFPWNAILCIVAVALTVSWFLCNGWLHEKLIGLKNSYEDKPR